jgi:hypothetical protein
MKWCWGCGIGHRVELTFPLYRRAFFVKWAFTMDLKFSHKNSKSDTRPTPKLANPKSTIISKQTTHCLPIHDICIAKRIDTQICIPNNTLTPKKHIHHIFNCIKINFKLFSKIKLNANTICILFYFPLFFLEQFSCVKNCNFIYILCFGLKKQ